MNLDAMLGRPEIESYEYSFAVRWCSQVASASASGSLELRGERRFERPRRGTEDQGRAARARNGGTDDFARWVKAKRVETKWAGRALFVEATRSALSVLSANWALDRNGLRGLVDFAARFPEGDSGTVAP